VRSASSAERGRLERALAQIVGRGGRRRSGTEHGAQRPVLPRNRSGARRRSASLWVAPELADPLGALEVGQHQDVEELGAGSRSKRVQALT
jgi:hypothetical protein